MSDDYETDEDTAEWVPTAKALEISLFTVTQLRALVTAGIVKTQRAKMGGATLYNVADLRRFDGMPRADAETAETANSPLLAEVRVMVEGFKSMLELSLKQTKQAQDHERMLIQAFSKPLENLGDSSKSLVTAVLEQNKQLVQRANDGDAARLDFVKAAETMLRDQRNELREQAELDRKHALKLEMWEGVKKAAPKLLEGFKATTGADRLEAAAKLKEKLDPAKVAAIIKFELLGEEEIGLLITALGLDRAELDRINAEADAAAAAEAAEAAE